jgi:hypothetical protein
VFVLRSYSCEEQDVKESDCEQSGEKRRRCEELINEHVREKIKRYKKISHAQRRGRGRNRGTAASTSA